MPAMRAGTILEVDLTSGRIARHPTGDYARRWLGGRGVNARLLWERLTPQTDPLGAANPLIFSTGPFTGTMVPGSGRTEIAAQSPVTGEPGMSNIGGFWGPELKYAGYDTLVVTGCAATPVYLAMDNDRVEIRDAKCCWGLDTYAAPPAIRRDLREPEAQVMCIGPAGEHCVVWSTIQTAVGQSAGRTGMGAVMGAKNLKAVAVRGTRGVTIAHPEVFLQQCLEAFETQKKSGGAVSTTDAVADPDGCGLVLGNFEAGRWDREPDLAGGHEPFWRRYRNRTGDGRLGCFNCQLRCSDYYDVPGLGPLSASCSLYVNSMWLVKDADFMAWYRLASLCQRSGLDVIAACRMLAWAMELRDAGRIGSADTDGLELKWGNSAAVEAMLSKMVRREGFGDVLACDAATAASRIGDGVPPPLNAKGSPLAGTNVVNFRSRALGSALSPRGGDDYRMRYNAFERRLDGSARQIAGLGGADSFEMQIMTEHRGPAADTPDAPAPQFDYARQGVLAAASQRLITVSDVLGQCRLGTVQLGYGVGIDRQAKLLAAGTGRPVTVDDLLEVADRVACQEKASLLRAGWNRARDTLPERVFNRPLPGTWPDDELDRERFEDMQADYYAAMGWDRRSGVPTAQTFARLGLDDVARDLAAQGHHTIPPETSEPSEAPCPLSRMSS